MLLFVICYFITFAGISMFFYSKLKHTNKEKERELTKDDEIYMNVFNYCIDNLNYNLDDSEIEPILVECNGDMRSITLLRILSEMYITIHVINCNNVSDNIEKLFVKLNNNNVIQYHSFIDCDEDTKILHYDNICKEYNIKYILNTSNLEIPENEHYTVHNPLENIMNDKIKDFVYKYNILYDENKYFNMSSKLNENKIDQIKNTEVYNELLSHLKDILNNDSSYMKHGSVSQFKTLAERGNLSHINNEMFEALQDLF